MNEQEQQLEKIEIDINVAKGHIDKKKSLERLSNNKDFIALIEVGYFEKEASRSVLLRAAPSAQDEDIQNGINNTITGIGELKQYFVKIMHFGRMAEQSLVEDEKTQEEISAEELEQNG